MATAICIQCGLEFVALRQATNYCSRSCWLAYRKKIPKRVATRECGFCGKEFTSPDQRKKYCSKKCNVSTQNKKRPTTKEDKRECPQCGESFSPMQKRGVGKTFCSSKCKSKFAYRKNHKEILEQNKVYSENSIISVNRKEAIKRDGYTCQLCKHRMFPSKWSEGRYLVVHHRDGSCEKEIRNHDVENLITLCAICHREFHKLDLIFINGEYFVRGKIFGLLGLKEVKATT